MACRLSLSRPTGKTKLRVDCDHAHGSIIFIKSNEQRHRPLPSSTIHSSRTRIRRTTPQPVGHSVGFFCAFRCLFVRPPVLWHAKSDALKSSIHLTRRGMLYLRRSPIR